MQHDYREIHPVGSDWRDARLILLWEKDRPVIGRWDDGRKGWEDPEGMHLFEEITYWADINSPK